MKTLQEIKDEVANKSYDCPFKEAMEFMDRLEVMGFINDTAELYASQFKQEWVSPAVELPKHPEMEGIDVLTLGYDNNYVASFFEGEFYDKQQNDGNGNPLCISKYITEWCYSPPTPPTK